LDGVAERDFSGRSVSTAGDVNGDGFDDVIVGAHGADPNGNYAAGSSYVVFGQASGFSAAMNLSSLDGSNGFRLDGETVSDFSGISVSTAGDVNGDGFDDVIVGATRADPNGYDSGSSYVVFGQASGFSATMDLSSLNGSNGFRLDGEAYDLSGWSVSTAGDVNGDGFDDLIVSALNTYPNGNRDSGSSYVVFGKASGFSATMNLSSLNGSNGFRLDGVAERDLSGESVSTAGDVNGDGFDDLIVGAPGAANPNGDRSGSSYVVFGQASGFSAAMDLSSLNGSNGFRLDGEALEYSGNSVSTAGDVNGDGFDDVIVGANRADPNGDRSGSSYVVFGQASGFSAAMDLSSLNGSNGFRLDGEAMDDLSGESVSTAGDVNGDGLDDLIVGARGTSAYVVFGQASGFSAAMDLSSLDDSNGFRLNGGNPGTSISTAGDVNGDGFDDLIVGAAYDAPNGSRSGSSYVIFGRSDFGSGLPEILGTIGDDILKGTTAAERFKAGDGNDKLIGRGGADIFEGGAGIDVLHLAGTGLNLNLADSGDRISDIEIISLYSQGDHNTLTLTAADLRNLSITTNTLKVNGNAGGHIIVEDSGWIDGGSRGDGYYHVYTQDDAVLLVGQNLTVDFVV
jgi:hypothetical protein